MASPEPIDVAAALDEIAARELRARATLEEIRLLMEMEYDFLCRPWDQHPWELLLYEIYRLRNGAGPRPPYAFTFEACYAAVTMLGVAGTFGVE